MGPVWREGRNALAPAPPFQYGLKRRTSLPA
jgi:hypothetical protein